MLDGAKAVCILCVSARMSPAPQSKPLRLLEHLYSFFYFICVLLRLYVRQKMWMSGQLLGQLRGRKSLNQLKYHRVKHNPLLL